MGIRKLEEDYLEGIKEQTFEVLLLQARAFELHSEGSSSPGRILSTSEVTLVS